MPKITPSLFVATMLALAAPAHAQQARSFVSNVNGNDANAPNCLRNAPCRTFQVAHNNTLAGGEITVLDPGSYGAVTITKSISIINDGVGEAGTLVSGGLNGITINAGANDRVSLRGLTIKGIGFGGGNGIVFTSGKFLSVEHCVIRNLTGTAQNQFIGYGIVFNPISASELAVSNTLVSDNEGHGISVVPNSQFAVGRMRATFSFVQVYQNRIHGIVFGINPNAPDFIAAADNVVSSDNGFSGFAIEGTGGAGLNVTRSVVSGNGTGFSASGTFGAIAVGQSNVTSNTVTWTGRVVSYGDNYVEFNKDGVVFAPLGPNQKR